MADRVIEDFQFLVDPPSMAPPSQMRAALRSEADPSPAPSSVSILRLVRRRVSTGLAHVPYRHVEQRAQWSGVVLPAAEGGYQCKPIWA
jgi:hypothetical protein